ncbi:MAG: DEAD/DEAH box helicase [Eubacteriales bacterium]|nr:DEAD/DEAH box helicase [Eubacteriales bacterium]
MNKNFNDLGISPPILKAIEEMGFQKPTEVQSRVIPHILNKIDMIVMSKTGSGKTAVFGIPLLQMSDPSSMEPQCLILTPTRELAVQIDNDLKQMSAYLTHKTTAVYGQHSMKAEIQNLKKGVSIVTGTPGRIYDHIRNGHLKVKQVRYLVLDEADRMLDMGFIDQVFKIIKTLSKDRITLLFSATMPSEIKSICRGYMKNPITVEIESQTKTVDTIDQTYYRVNKNEKRTQIHRILMTETPESCLIFCNTRYAADHVHRFLSSKGYASQAIHGDIPQSKRLRIMEQFKNGGIHLLVATDVAARGIHIEDLSLVVNYDVPLEKDSYVHRIGRTGRAGKGGRAITLVTSDDIMSLYEIEEHTGSLIKESELPSDSVVEASRENAEKWIKEKYQNSVLAAAKSAKENHNNKPRKKSGYNKDKRRSRPAKETGGVQGASGDKTPGDVRDNCTRTPK